MNKEIFKTLIKEGQDELVEVTLFPRHFEFEPESRHQTSRQILPALSTCQTTDAGGA